MYILCLILFLVLALPLSGFRVARGIHSQSSGDVVQVWGNNKGGVRPNGVSSCGIAKKGISSSSTSLELRERRNDGDLKSIAQEARNTYLGGLGALCGMLVALPSANAAKGGT